MKKRILKSLALFLSLAMTITSLPGAVNAAEEGGVESTVSDVTFELNADETTAAEDFSKVYEDESAEVITQSAYADDFADGYGLSGPRKDDNDNTVWDCVWFGEYWQNDTNGDGTADTKDEKKPIKWRVLSISNNRALLLADKNLDCKPFHTAEAMVTWENCTLRSWLNGYGKDKNNQSVSYESNNFIDTAFNNAEKLAIKYYFWDIQGEFISNESDRIWLLTLDDVVNTNYGFKSDTMIDRSRMGENTPFAIAQGGFTSEEENYAGYGWWWLRSSGENKSKAADISFMGCVEDIGWNVNTAINVVRPALYLDLTKTSVWSTAGIVTAENPTASPSASPSPGASNEPGETPTPSVSPSVGASNEPGETPTPSVSPSVGASNEPGETPTPSVSPSVGASKEPGETPTPSVSPSVGASNEPGETPMPSVSNEPSETTSPGASSEPSASTSSGADNEPSETPSASPDTEPSETPSEKPSESPSPGGSEEPGEKRYKLYNPRKDTSGATVWDCVWFGSYWNSDTNGDGKATTADAKSPIKWRVLSIDGDKALLLSDQILDAACYDMMPPASYGLTWEICTLRSWLNGYGAASNKKGVSYESDNFIDNAFDSAQQNAIIKSTIVNADAPNGTDGGNNTEDKVFVLSIDEMLNKSYGFTAAASDTTNSRKAVTTDFATKRGAGHYYSNEEKAYTEESYYWLRTPGKNEYWASLVTFEGNVSTYGVGVDYSVKRGVRPAIYLDLSQLSVWSNAGIVKDDKTCDETAFHEVMGGIEIPEEPIEVYVKDKLDLSQYNFTTQTVSSYQVKVDNVVTKKYASISKKGILTAKKSGTLLIEALDKNKNVLGSMMIIVRKAYFDKMQIPVLTKTNETVDLNGYLKDVPQKGYTLTFETKSKIGSVSEAGVVTAGVKSGKITATAVFTNAGGKRFTVKIPVTVKLPKHSLKPVTVKNGKNKTLQVTNLIGQEVIWKSSNPNIASVAKSEKSTTKTAKATVTGNTPGTAVITATIEGIEYSFTVNVK